MQPIPNEQLESLLCDIESDRAKRKQAWSGDAPDKARQAVCAFANDLPNHQRPSILFVGAKDDGSPSGMAITDKLLQTLADIRCDGNTVPPPTLFVEKRCLAGAEMAVVTVLPADAPPVRFNGRIWVRIGDKIKATLAVSVDFTSGSTTEIRSSPYPLVALQQLCRNAVLHRTYEHTNAPVRVYWFDDRIEITNPGGPYGTVTAENFGRPGISDYRNPQLASVLKTLGFVQRFGFGIADARKALADNGNPPLEFQVETTTVLATLRRAP